MIIFLDEDRAYLAWLARQRRGFVLDALRWPTKKRPTLHRAACDEIRHSPTRRSHWTTGRRLKACAARREELIEWSAAEYTAPVSCPQCRPDDVADRDQPPRSGGGDARLTKLGAEVVDHVTEVALIHLDNGDREYHLTVGDIARCFNKTPAQLAAVLARLCEDGYLCTSEIVPGTQFPENCTLYPTIDLLRKLPAYATAPGETIEAELSRLRPRACGV